MIEQRHQAVPEASNDGVSVTEVIDANGKGVITRHWKVRARSAHEGRKSLGRTFCSAPLQRLADRRPHAPTSRRRSRTGSGCSIVLGAGVTEMTPGSQQRLQLVVSDIQAARAELVERGVEVSEVQELPGGSFVFFSDPDGNGWSVQDPSSA